MRDLKKKNTKSTMEVKIEKNRKNCNWSCREHNIHKYFIGINKILFFDKIGFFSLLSTIGIILYIIYIDSKERKIIVQNTLNIAEMIYTMDYSQLTNIRKIEIIYTENCEYKYQVYLKNCKDSHFNLLEQMVPKSQEELNILDKQFEKMNKKD